MNKKPLFLCLVLFFLVGIFAQIGLAIPPIKQTNTGSSGYLLETPQHDLILLNTTTNIQVHVFNISNGMPIKNTSTTCYLHLYNRTNNHILDMEQRKIEHTFDFEFNIAGGNFTEYKTLSLIVQCNDTTAGLGGFTSYQVQVVNQSYIDFIYNNMPSSTVQDSLKMIGLVIAICLLAFLFLFFALNLNEEHFLLKLMLIFISLFLVMIIPSSFISYGGTVETLLKLCLWVFRIFVTYFVIFISYHWFKKTDMFMQMFNK